MECNSIEFDKFMELHYDIHMIPRKYEPLERHLAANKVLVIYGPRRVGKTTLLQNYLTGTGYKYKLDSGDNIRAQQILGSQDFDKIISYVEGYELVAIDEAQAIPNIGKGLKIIVDQVPGIRVIVTGSSSFELAGQVGEPLTGRKTTLTLFPLSQAELMFRYNRHELHEHLNDFLIYGSYPEVILAENRMQKIDLLNELANSYLLKDILAFDRVKNSQNIFSLLKLLAFQVGSEVSFNEIATQIGLDVKTVQRYIDLLEKSFILLRLSGYSKNLRQEVTSKSKYYFMDTGIRNAIIAQFNPIDQRDDIGRLWENFLVVERNKQRVFNSIYANPYFWRTYSQEEIDLVEERDGRLFGFEFKWSQHKKSRLPKTFQANYPDSDYQIIHPGNYLQLIVD